MSNTNEPENLRCDTKERTIDAPCQVVFHAFSDPNQLERWWGPERFANSFCEFYLREGGYWRFTMPGPKGKNYPNECRFLEVIQKEKLVIEHLSDHYFFLS